MKGIEVSLETALRRACSLQYLGLLWLGLFLSGLIVIFSHAISQDIHPWARLGFMLLPIFLSSWILLTLGTLLLQKNHRTTPTSFAWKEVMHESISLLTSTTLLALPSLLLFIVLWVVLGLFFLFQQIPLFGHFFSILFSFAPFLSVCALFVLIFAQTVLLFFAPPLIASESPTSTHLISRLIAHLAIRPLYQFFFFCIGWIPLLIWASLLFWAVHITETGYLQAYTGLSLGLSLFFLMVPLTLLLTPACSFFFYWSYEAYRLHRNV